MVGRARKKAPELPPTYTPSHVNLQIDEDSSKAAECRSISSGDSGITNSFLSQQWGEGVGNKNGVSFDQSSLYSMSQNLAWDRSEVIPPRMERKHKSKRMAVCLKITKLLVYIICFVLILGCSILSKSTLLQMSSNILLNTTQRVHLTKDYYHIQATWNNSGALTKFLSDIVREGEDNTDQLVSNVSESWKMWEEQRISQWSQMKVWIPLEVSLQYYWCLMILLFIPNVLIFVRCIRQISFKKTSAPSFTLLAFTWFVESAHVTGLCTFVFHVIPGLGLLRSVLLLPAVCLVPAVLKMLSRPMKPSYWWAKLILDALSLGCQISALFLWQFPGTLAWEVPLALTCMGLVYWENYADRTSPLRVFQWLGGVRDDLRRMRSQLYVWMSLWKMLLTFAYMLLFMHVRFRLDTPATYLNVNQIFRDQLVPVDTYNTTIHNIIQAPGPVGAYVSSVAINMSSVMPVRVLVYYQISVAGPVYLALVSSLSTFLVYQLAKFACKVCMQRQGPLKRGWWRPWCTPSHPSGRR